ncbi:hypothetical protein MPER_16167, partial [Moniliophthora perniciosa FA553]
MPTGAAAAIIANANSTTGSKQRREPSGDYDDYDDQYEDDHYNGTEEIEEQMRHAQLDEDVPDTTMLDSVILPAIASEARVALSALQRAFTEAERVIPGVCLELVNEIVDS